MLTLEQIKDRLQDRRIDKVAKATGLARQTVHEIKVGINTNPKLNTMLALSAYLEINQ
jgi:DNA-binding XRE family transcriptional regulator